MLDARHELIYLREAVPLLQNYLLGHDTAWQLPGVVGDGMQPYTLLTLGPLLFILKRLKARRLDTPDQEELGRYEEQIFQDKIHNEKAWKKKAGQDLSSRTRLWQQYLDEYKKDTQVVIAAYSTSVAQRVMLQLLGDEMEPVGLFAVPLQYTLDFLDVNLKMSFQPGDFIWEQELQSAFQEKTYWYLYGNLKENANLK